MKKIVLSLLIFVTGTASAQTFPSQDSLENFIDRYIRNEAINAFTNMRLNTALHGVIDVTAPRIEPSFLGIVKLGQYYPLFMQNLETGSVHILQNARYVYDDVDGVYNLTQYHNQRSSDLMFLNDGSLTFSSTDQNAVGGQIVSMTPKFTIDNTGTVQAAKYSLSSLNTAPSSANDTGTAGEIRVTSSYIYVCIATNTWVRAALATW
jgi:hypothetical protein